MKWKNIDLYEFFRNVHWYIVTMRGLPWWPIDKEPASAGEVSLIFGSRRFPEEGNDNLPQYSCLGNPMDRGAWQAAVHGGISKRVRQGLLTEQEQQQVTMSNQWMSLGSIPWIGKLFDIVPRYSPKFTVPETYIFWEFCSAISEIFSS